MNINLSTVWGSLIYCLSCLRNQCFTIYVDQLLNTGCFNRTSFAHVLKPVPQHNPGCVYIFIPSLIPQPHYNKARALSVDALQPSWIDRRVPKTMYPAVVLSVILCNSLTFPSPFVLSSILVWGVVSLTLVPKAPTEMSRSLGSSQAWDSVMTTVQPWRGGPGSRSLFNRVFYNP